jgi:phosphoribosyl 1,2-cyclic phosphodiesterase
VRVHFCGVRGSTPAPGTEFARYGGNTSCLALSAGPEDGPPTLLLDAGTGARRVTSLLAGAPFVGTILLTHLHWDHVQGLPFFRAGDRPDAEVSLLLPEQDDGADAEEILARSMSPPHFPIRPSQLRGSWTFNTLRPGAVEVGAFHVEARWVPHKGGPTLGYRVSDGTSTIAYLPDHCPTAVGPGPDGWGEYHRTALELTQDVDVLVHDAHLQAEELAAEAAFGHAAADYAVALGQRSGARRVVLFHHKPERTDDDLDRLGCRFRNAPVAVTMATETTVLEL